MNNKVDDQEQVLHLVRELLPDIEKAIKLELEEDFSQQFDEWLNLETNKLKENSRIQIEETLLELQKKTQEEFQKLCERVESKEAKLEKRKSDRNNELEHHLRKEFEVEKEKLIKDLVRELSEGESLEVLEAKLKKEMQEELEAQIKEEILKKEKSLNITLLKKLEKEKKQIEETYELEWRQKIKSERSSLEQERSEITRLKSVVNIRMKKVEDDKKNFEKEMQTLEQKYTDIIAQLEREVTAVEKKRGLADKAQPTTTVQTEVSFGKGKSAKRFSKSAANNLKSEQGVELERQLGVVPEKLDSVEEKEEEQEQERLSTIMNADLLKMTSKTPFSLSLMSKMNVLPPPEKAELNFKNENLQMEHLTPPELIIFYDQIDSKPLRSERKQNKLMYDIEDLNNEAKLNGQSNNIWREDRPKNRNGCRPDSGLKNPTHRTSDLKENNEGGISRDISLILSENKKKRDEEKKKYFKDFKKKYEEALMNPTASKGKGKAAPRQILPPEEVTEVPGKYDHIIKKYLNERQNFKRPEASQHQGSLRNFQSLFRLSEDDDRKTREMKVLSDELNKTVQKDQDLEGKFKAMRVYFLNQMPDRLPVDKYTRHDTQLILERIDQLWSSCDWSFKERLDFISVVELLLNNPDDFENKAKGELEFLEHHSKASSEIIKNLRERTRIRCQLNSIEFSLGDCKPLLMTLKNLALHLSKYVELYNRNMHSTFTWKKIDLNALIASDLWEIEHVEKEEWRRELVEKIKKKIL